MYKSILLINPWIYDFAAYDFWIKPLGLLYIASFLRSNGYSVNLIDCLNPFHPGLKNEHNIRTRSRKNFGHGKYPKEEISKPDALKDFQKKYNRYGITPSLFRQSLKNIEKPNLILVTSMMTYWYPGVFEVIQILREETPGTPIILGGNYVTFCPDHAIKSGADFIITGSIGEKKIPLVLKDIFNDDIKFLPDFNNLDSYPYPAFDLLPYKDQFPILTSRGCPFKCSYCASNLLNNRFLQRDPMRVVDEISFWNAHFGIQNFSFYDDALLVDPEKMAIPMMKEIINRRIHCFFHCPNGLHLREIREEIGRLMYQAGFKTIRFGFETSNERMQTTTGGKVNNSHLKEAVIHLRKAGYQTHNIGIYLLCGIPGQSSLDIMESIHYVKSCGARPILAEYSPIPGTALWDIAIMNSPYPISEEPLYHNNSLLPCQSDLLTYEMYNELKLIAKDK